MIAVHCARYSAKFYGLTDDAIWRKTASGIAMACGLVASISLFLLAMIDTFRFHREHLLLLLVCFGGLLFSSLATSLVWFEQAWKPSGWHDLRKWSVRCRPCGPIPIMVQADKTCRCVINNIFLVLGLVAGVAFNVLLANSWMRTAGILEWALTYTGAFWLLTFVGYLKYDSICHSHQCEH